MKGITVQIKNFKAFKGRADNKHNSWFRCSNRLLEDPDFYEFSHTDLLVWIYILSLASQKNSDTVFIHFERAERISRLKKREILAAVEKLNGNQLVPLQDPASIPQVSPKSATIQTDNTDNTLESGDSIPAVGEIWNAIVKCRPKIRAWNVDRDKALGKVMPDPDEWRLACEKVEASEFLSGRSGKWDGASFDWLLDRKNLTKVLEGNYDRRQAPNGGFLDAV